MTYVKKMMRGMMNKICPRYFVPLLFVMISVGICGLNGIYIDSAVSKYENNLKVRTINDNGYYTDAILRGNDKIEYNMRNKYESQILTETEHFLNIVIESKIDDMEMISIAGDAAVYICKMQGVLTKHGNAAENVISEQPAQYEFYLTYNEKNSFIEKIVFPNNIGNGIEDDGAAELKRNEILSQTILSQTISSETGDDEDYAILCDGPLKTRYYDIYEKMSIYNGWTVNTDINARILLNGNDSIGVLVYEDENAGTCCKIEFDIMSGKIISIEKLNFSF